MTIGELKEIIRYLDDDMKVGGAGHFGEYLECIDVQVREVGMPIEDREEILCITLEDPGEDPDEW